MKINSLVFFFLLSLALSSQPDTALRRMVHNACLGLNIGAATPVPLPANVRKVNSWKPGLNISCGYEGLFLLKKNWRIGAGLKLDYRGMTVRNEVLYMRTKITVQGSSNSEGFEGYFSGGNETKVKNIYITVPLYIAYRIKNTWRIKAGGYCAYMFQSVFSGTVYDGYIRKGSPLGEKINITEANFDLSQEQNRLDFGLLFGTQHSITSSLSLIANFTWGLNPLLKKGSSVDFNMYNIFLNLGVAYRL